MYSRSRAGSQDDSQSRNRSRANSSLSVTEAHFQSLHLTSQSRSQSPANSIQGGEDLPSSSPPSTYLQAPQEEDVYQFDAFDFPTSQYQLPVQQQWEDFPEFFPADFNVPAVQVHPATTPAILQSSYDTAVSEAGQPAQDMKYDENPAV